jgi:hypothetical protein
MASLQHAALPISTTRARSFAAHRPAIRRAAAGTRTPVAVRASDVQDAQEARWESQVKEGRVKSVASKDAGGCAHTRFTRESHGGWRAARMRSPQSPGLSEAPHAQAR